jgi:hypothetical protein
MPPLLATALRFSGLIEANPRPDFLPMTMMAPRNEILTTGPLAPALPDRSAENEQCGARRPPTRKEDDRTSAPHGGACNALATDSAVFNACVHRRGGASVPRDLERCVLWGQFMKIPMKRIALLCSGATLAFACSKSPEPATTSPAASAATSPPPIASTAPNAPFEGEIVVAIKDDASKKLPTSITYDVKGNKVRYVPTSAPVYAIGDLDTQQAYAVGDAQKTYDAIDIKPAANAKTAPGPKVQKTGKTEKLVGLDCENWTIDDGNEKVDVCASKGIAYFDLAGDAKAGSSETPWAVALTTEKAFPLRVVVHDKLGKEEYRADAVRADRKKIDDAMFQPPTAYKKTTVMAEMKTASLP